MENLIKVTSDTLAKILTGEQTAYLFHSRTGYKAGDKLVFSDGGRKVGVTYKGESGGALGAITDQEATRLGYADVNAFATAWDLEQRNREESKKFAKNPSVTTIAFDTPEYRGGAEPAKPPKKSVSRGPLGRKKAAKAPARKKRGKR